MYMNTGLVCIFFMPLGTCVSKCLFGESLQFRFYQTPSFVIKTERKKYRTSFNNRIYKIIILSMHWYIEINYSKLSIINGINSIILKNLMSCFFYTVIPGTLFYCLVKAYHRVLSKYYLFNIKNKTLNKRKKKNFQLTFFSNQIYKCITD